MAIAVDDERELLEPGGEDEVSIRAVDHHHHECGERRPPAVSAQKPGAAMKM